MNLRFCRWLRDRGREGMDVRVMFHEPYFYFTASRPWRNVLAAVQRVMARAARPIQDGVRLNRILAALSDAEAGDVARSAADPVERPTGSRADARHESGADRPG